MFCIQCEQTRRSAHSDGCVQIKGVCGKTETVSNLQDVLVYHLQGVAFWANLARQKGIINAEIDLWLPRTLFSTLTNVNFDAQRILAYIQTAQRHKITLQSALLAIHIILPVRDVLPDAAHAIEVRTLDEALSYASIAALNPSQNVDSDGLRLLCLYGLKGAAAYLAHAQALNQDAPDILATLYQLLANLLMPLPENDLFAMTMQIGELNYHIMKLLDQGATSQFGHPEPSQVNIQPVAGQSILVSGHDLHNLYHLLVQTEGLGINVYTHGEMLPAHGYPALKQFSHLVGHYGGAWQDQQQEFADFPGAIVMTSNCLIDPNVGQYADRLFTCNMVGWPLVKQITNDDYSEVIACTQKLAGFSQTRAPEMLTVGFGHQALLASVPTLKTLVEQGKIKHVFLIGGCDGAGRKRHYFTEYAENVPDDALILTLGCGKFRFNKSIQTEVAGLPKVIDIGQCNDAYSAIQLAMALSSVFNCSINELPLTLVLSWFEQKAIVVLLTLLSLGVKGIYIGPTAPAFLTENNLKVLQDMFDLRLTGTAESDLAFALSS